MNKTVYSVEMTDAYGTRRVNIPRNMVTHLVSFLAEDCGFTSEYDAMEDFMRIFAIDDVEGCVFQILENGEDYMTDYGYAYWSF